MNLQLILDKSIDLLVAIIGVGLGSYLALYIAKFQLNQQTKQEQERNTEITATLIGRCRIELRDNKSALKNQLIPIFDLSGKPHELHYEWMLAIAESFERVSYEDLLSMNLSHNMPKRVEGHLSSSYRMLEGLNGMVKIALAGFKYQNLYGGTPDYRQTSFNNIKTYSQTVCKHIEYSLNEIEKHIEKQKNKKI